ncbi:MULTISPECIES: hypothetical protein [Niastella]|uniref:Uncharacterized protein n=1 Tax=Niastella soli TaxID=2821487 RepID=A0ABS3YUM0_9BACT|nr:hypothetical protein [Niastella soli]MBO9201590.1 hypothetical protein [Niastella soli]
MPTFPPRKEPIKKKEQLSQRQSELWHALNKKLPDEKINKAVERYRIAQLSMLKAKIHEDKDRQYENKSPLHDFENLQKEILAWTNKTVEEIIKDFEKNFNKLVPPDER